MTEATPPAGLPGPYPIVNRGHSGGRLLCEAFIRNGVDMGNVHAKTLDTKFWVLWTLPQGRSREILRAAFRYQDLSPPPPPGGADERLRLQALMRRKVAEYRQADIQRPGPFGWKLGFMLFAAPLLLDSIPSARVVHLLRDGRDVMLTRLGRIGCLHWPEDPMIRRAILGSSSADSFCGRPLNAETIARFRNALEMQHWVTAVRHAMACRRYTGRYLEVRYEDLCTAPLQVFERICDFLQLPLRPEAGRWLLENAHTKSIGKWRALSEDELRLPLEIGGELLRELGYLSQNERPGAPREAGRCLES